jgi:LPXTG-motif cell wall-anchored protein
MKPTRFLAALVLCLGVTALAVAQEAVQRDTQLAVSEPTQVGPLLLDPGSYTLRVHDYKGEKVQVTIVRDSDKKAMGTATAIRARRNLDSHQASDNQTHFTYTTYNGHPAVSSWYYPGDEWGEQFVYGGQADEMTMRQTPAPAASTMAVSTPPPPAPPAEERHEEMKVAEAAPAPAPEAAPAPASAPPPMAAPAPAPAPAPAASPAPHHHHHTLPKTASAIPLAALAGALSLVGAAGIRLRRRKAA